MKTVWCIPSNVLTNKYMYLMQMAMKKAGYKVLGPGERLKKINSAIIHLNWFENIDDDKTAQYVYYKKKFLLFLFQLSKKRIIFTMHNKQPHDKKSNHYSKKLLLKLMQISDVIIIHSRYSMQVIEEKFQSINLKKVVYVPHPNYKYAYKDLKTYKNFSKLESELVFCFIGQIRPYKNVEVLIQAANRFSNTKDIKFLICGKSINDDYKLKIEQMKTNQNIIFDLRFIEDNEIVSLMKQIDVVILPYSTESALNSAAAILAFTYGKTVLSTNVGTVIDLKDTGDLYSYQYYSNEAKHVEILVSKIQEIYKIFQSDHDIIKQQGINLKNRVLTENSIEIIENSLKKIYL